MASAFRLNKLSVIIRPASWASDSRILAQIDRDVFSPCWTAKEFLDTLTQANVYCLLADADSKPAGFCIFLINRRRTVEIVSIAVVPKFRRKSIGRCLIAAASSEVLRPRDGTLPKVATTVRESSVDVLKFFCAIGFNPIRLDRDLFKRANGLHEDGVRLVKYGETTDLLKGAA
jgi:ribosomal protein S18 acetylase RimI-like enzyme